MANDIRYYEGIKKNDCMYSVDMVRLDLELKQDSLESLSAYLSNPARADIEVFSPCFKNYAWRNMFKVSVGSSALVIGIGWNSTNRDDMLKGFIEFNPNKTMPKAQNDIDFIRNCCWSVSIKRMDIAVDVPVNLRYVTVEKDNRIMRTYSRGNEVETIELGIHQHNLFKAYNKALESHLNDDLTRFEVTVQLSTKNLFKELLRAFPTIYIDEMQQKLIDDSKLNSSQQVLVQVIRNSEQKDLLMRQLNYKLRKKLEPYVYANSTKFEPDINIIYNLIVEIKREYEK